MIADHHSQPVKALYSVWKAVQLALSVRRHQPEAYRDYVWHRTVLALEVGPCRILQANHYLTPRSLVVVEGVLPLAQSVGTCHLQPLNRLCHLIVAEPMCCEVHGPVWRVSRPLES